MTDDDEGAGVATTAGRVRGLRSAQATAFLGIPYAEVPVGARRWAPPVARTAWDGVRDATQFGSACWQPIGGPLDDLVPGMGSADQGDDCLSLNVWTPRADDEARPVLVWFHGGAFSLGAGSLPVYDGMHLAVTHDVVVVTCNYRLGALGFVVFDDPSCAPNVGMLDQASVLAWVRDNIAGFGGDPDRVTIFGESAGGGSVLSLLTMPAASGLFHGAIVQSGATDLLLDRARTTEVAEAFATAAGVEIGDVDALRSLPSPAVVAAQVAAAASLFATVGTMPFHPCVDGEVIPRSWLEAAEDGTNPVPLIIGTTRDEMALFAGFDPSHASLDDAGLARRMARLGLAETEDAIATYRRDGLAEAPAIWSRVQTDTSMWMPALRIAEAHVAHAPVWMYRFDRSAADPSLGACHGVDIPFAFGTTDSEGWGAFLGDAPSARALSTTIGVLWSSFARDGRPSAPDLTWPPFDPVRRATLVLGDEVEVVSDPSAHRRRLWSAAPA